MLTPNLLVESTVGLGVGLGGAPTVTPVAAVEQPFPSSAGLGGPVITASPTGPAPSGSAAAVAHTLPTPLGNVIISLFTPPGNTPVPNGPPAVLTFHNQPITAGPSSDFVFSGQTLTAGTVVAGQTLLPGGPAITVAGTTVSLAPGATATVLPAQTLTPGGPAITVSGTPISLVAGPTAAVVIDGATSVLGGGGSSPQTVVEPVLTVAGTAFTGSPQDVFVIGGQTLVAGGSAITVDGTVLVLPTGGTQVIVGGVTSALASVTVTLAGGASVTAGLQSGAEGRGRGRGWAGGVWWTGMAAVAGTGLVLGL
jgi:hypothetical protein